MSPTINTLRATVQYNLIYTCADCGKKQHGLTQRIEIDENNYSDFYKKLRLTSYGMPIGWTSNYGRKSDIFTCGCGKK